MTQPSIVSSGRRGSTVVPNWRWEDPDLDPYELRIAGWLASHADHYLAEAVTRNVVAKRTGVSQGKVTLALQRLTELGIIAVEELTIPQGQGGKRLQITFAFDAWEKQPWSPDDQGPVTTRPGPGHDVTATKDPQVVEQQEPDPPTPPDPEFDSFWSLYPRKSDKQEAKRAFRAALKRASLEEILRGLGPWRDHWAARNEPEFIPHARKWLHNDRWTEDPGPVRTNGNVRRNAYFDLLNAEHDAAQPEMKEIDR